MDNSRKLAEELLQADGIDPNGATESERTAFVKMLDQQSKSKPSKPDFRPDIWSKIMKSNITKSAAAAIIVLGAFIFLTTNGASLAWADVVEHFTNPYQCTQTVYYGNKEHQTIKLYRLNLSQRREERPNNETFIVDMRQTPVCTLYLYNNDKLAQVRKDYGMGQRKDPDWLQMLTNMETSDAEELGVQEINGSRAKGFRTVSKYNDITIWADIETGLPVQVVIIHLQNDRKIVLEDFQFDINFDPTLFSTEPPTGYQVHEVSMNQKIDDAEKSDETGSTQTSKVADDFKPYSCEKMVYRGGKKVYTSKFYRKNLSVRRDERDYGTIFIFDMTEKPMRILTLKPESMTAELKLNYKFGPSSDPDMRAWLARMQNGDAEKLGIQEIDGVQAEGFRDVDPHNEITIWAGIETGLPVKIEIVHPKRDQKIVMDQFDFETELDDSLFLLTPPEGYELNEKHEGLDLKASAVTKEQVKQGATGYPVYALKGKLSWTLEPTIIEGNVPGESDMKLHGIAATSKDGRHISIAQCPVYNTLKEKIRDGGNKCLELNGFTVWNGGPEKWYSKIALESAEGTIPPGISEDRTGYAIETPADTVIIVGINGALSDEELLEMVKALELCTEPQQ